MCHLTYTAFSGKFDAAYFPENIYIPEFEYFMNIFTEYNSVLQDKNVLPYIANSLGIVTPDTLFSSSRGMLRDDNLRNVSPDEMISRLNGIGEVFCKPTVDSGCGAGCALISIVDMNDIISKQPACELFKSLGDDYVVQQKISCHKSISSIYPNKIGRAS